MAGYSEGAAVKATLEADVTARALDRMPRIGALGAQIATSVGWSRARYRLMCTYVWPERVAKVTASIKRATLRKVGLPPGTANVAVETMVWIAPAQEMVLDRVALLVKLLAAKGVEGRGLEGSIQQLQRWVGTEVPVLETKAASCRCVEVLGQLKACPWNEAASKPCRTSCGWNGSWVGMVHRSMGDLGISIQGGLGLPKLREGDRCLVDLADEKQREVVSVTR